jgi:hypothetical protein
MFARREEAFGRGETEVAQRQRLSAGELRNLC